ncbi:MAG: hypothetical protein ACFNVT_07245, partial [Corynebacterium matruchotii]|uniref:hypothetical protein n=1 Tax=Corynebacterium matruchotii TaxID=43768 RepID=UPI003614C08B
RLVQGPDGVSPRLPRRRRPANGPLTGLAKRRTRAVSGKQRSDSCTNEVTDGVGHDGWDAFRFPLIVTVWVCGG